MAVVTGVRPVGKIPASAALATDHGDDYWQKSKHRKLVR
jgi:hypothetical protein